MNSTFGDIVAERKVVMNQYSFFPSVQILPLIMSVNDEINLQQDDGEPGTGPVLYAPTGEINLNQMRLFGSTAAQLFTLNQATIQYPAELRGCADLPGAGLEILTYLFE